MAEIAASFLEPVIKVKKWVTKPIIRQFSSLFCHTSNINSLKDEAKKLDDATEGLQGEVDRARDNMQLIDPRVEMWLIQSNHIKDEIDGILSEAKNVGSGCLKVGARFSLSKRAKKITDRKKELRGEKNFEVKFQHEPPAARQAVQLGKTFECESRNKIEDDIMTTLRGGDVNMIGICGMGGLGKTTMARKIRNRVLNENVFQEVVMTVVSQQVDISKIQDEIGGQLGLKKLKEETSQGKVQKLHARLSGTCSKRILLILDDVWKGIKLEELGIPCDSKWCTILITSRNSDALSAMGCKVENIFGMKILSEEEAWYFFREGAGTCVDDTNLNSIAKEVVKECRGLPIALKTLGVALKEKDDASIWENALRELKQCDLDIPDFIKMVYTPLKWSYDFLESKQAKSLFLLCCLFPEDSNIPLEHLTYFYMGLRISEGIRNAEDARNKVSELTDTLKSRSLLLDSYERGHVRMHDVVRDVCIFIAKQEGCIGGNDCTWISLSQFVKERNQFLTKSRFPNLHLLFLSLSEEEFKFDNAFLEGIRDLNVLCIKINFSLTSLPHSMPCATDPLINLKTLLLDSCRELKTISVVGKLRNLEILIFRHCVLIEELPPEMKGLNRLKLLELTRCRKLQSIGRGIISSLVGLEELKMLGSFNKWEAEDKEERENAALRELEALPDLTRLEIEIEDPALATENMHLSSKIERFYIRIGAYSYFTLVDLHRDKKMSIRLEGESCLGDWIEMQLPSDTECLSLSGNGANNVDLAKFQNIQSLELGDCEVMKNILRTSMADDATVFPATEHLTLFSLPQLQEICDGPISSNSFQMLKMLEVRSAGLKRLWKSSSLHQNNLVPLFTNLSSIYFSDCHRLRNLGELSIAGKDCLPQLEQLRIWKCKMMEQVFLWNDEAAGEHINNSSQSQITKLFPKLKGLELVSLPNLSTFYEGIQGIEFPLLKEMKIEECPKMKSIIRSSSADIDDDHSLHLFCLSEKVSFGSLKVLEIDHNPFCAHKIPSSLLSGLEVFFHASNWKSC